MMPRETGRLTPFGESFRIRHAAPPRRYPVGHLEVSPARSSHGRQRDVRSIKCPLSKIGIVIVERNPLSLRIKVSCGILGREPQRVAWDPRLACRCLPLPLGWTTGWRDSEHLVFERVHVEFDVSRLTKHEGLLSRTLWFSKFGDLFRSASDPNSAIFEHQRLLLDIFCHMERRSHVLTAALEAGAKYPARNAASVESAIGDAKLVRRTAERVRDSGHLTPDAFHVRLQDHVADLVRFSLFKCLQCRVDLLATSCSIQCLQCLDGAPGQLGLGGTLVDEGRRGVDGRLTRRPASQTRVEERDVR